MRDEGAIMTTELVQINGRKFPLCKISTVLIVKCLQTHKLSDNCMPTNIFGVQNRK